jgi:hypothetical protein
MRYAIKKYFEEIFRGGFNPFSGGGGFACGWNLPIVEEPPEVVNPDNIE